MKARKRSGRKLSVTKEPMFPRYLIIALGTGLNNKGWASSPSTKGVSELVQFGNRPAKIDLHP
jgi:transcriptional antiterminator RfaH